MKCTDCGKEVRNAKFCSNCGSRLPKVEENAVKEVEEKIEEKSASYRKTFGIKLLMGIPNYLIILCICLLFYGIIGIIHDTQNPLSGFYKSSLYTDGYSAIGIILFIILIIYLFVKTDKKYFFMFKSGIFICLGITIVVFLLFKNSYKIERHYETTQKLNESIQKANETLQKQGYKDLSDYLEKNRDQLIDNYYNSN